MDENLKDNILKLGGDHLFLDEILATIISPAKNALSTAKRLLDMFQGDINSLARADIDELMQVKGIGENTACKVLAAFELSRRRNTASSDIRPKIACSREAYDVIGPKLMDKSYEEFWILIMNRSNRVEKSLRISEGSISGTVADPRKIFLKALHHKASSIILAHNHPSGQTKPSNSDIQLTDKLKNAGKLLDIQVLDHLIITQAGYYSFADEGTL
jgi:DNA repair protein RadC